MWNPSTCACECDMWCIQGQYLDYKKCICKNKLIGRVISKCTSLINETMINNKKNIVNDDATTNIFIGLFSVLVFIYLFSFAYSLILSGLKVKIYLKIKDVLIIEIIKW